MTWIEHHEESERLAAEAEVAFRAGRQRLAVVLWAQAAAAEARALNDLDPAKSRTLGISAVSAVSLYFKANELDQAQAVAYRWLASERVPAFASEQLKGLLQSIWSEQVRERADVHFAPGQVVVAVKGGQIVEGGAPLDLIVEKVQTVQSLFYRTAEFIRGLPHRKRGLPPKDIQESCRPWLFQTAPGSYQFAVAVQEVAQLDLWKPDEPRPQQVADQFLNILRVSIEDPESAFPTVVPDQDYRNTFLKLARELAPTGKTYGQLDIRSATGREMISLVPSTRKEMSDAIRAAHPKIQGEPTSETLRGVLRAVHLDKDWLEVTVGDKHLHVERVAETVDDVIGPMVNKPVLVQVLRAPQGRLTFVDIERDE